MKAKFKPLRVAGICLSFLATPLWAHGGLAEILVFFAYLGVAAATPIVLLILRLLLRKYDVRKEGRIWLSSLFIGIIGIASIYASSALAPGFKEGLSPVIFILAGISIPLIFIRFAWLESKDLSISIILGLAGLVTLPIFSTIMGYLIGGISLAVCR